jgi:hypothetical protein
VSTILTPRRQDFQFVGAGRVGRKLGSAAWAKFGPEAPPYTTTQAPDRGDILDVGGFSDTVFSAVGEFLGDGSRQFVAEVEAVEL